MFHFTRFIFSLLFIQSFGYEISLNEVTDCVQKNCDTENTNCVADSDCNSALQDFGTCFNANRYNVTSPYEECKGVSNDLYSTLMDCYENCDYNLILQCPMLHIALTMIQIYMII